jgi:hypothetical protein
VTDDRQRFKFIQLYSVYRMRFYLEKEREIGGREGKGRKNKIGRRKKRVSEREKQREGGRRGIETVQRGERERK